MKIVNGRTGATASCLAVLIGLFVLLAGSTTVHAQACGAGCVLDPSCDAPSSGCCYCEGEGISIGSYEVNGSTIDPNFSQAAGQLVAAKDLAAFDELDVEVPPPPNVERSAGSGFLADLPVSINPFQSVASLAALGAHLGVGVRPLRDAASEGVDAPTPQGGSVPTAPTGERRIVDEEGTASDPIDPITGEFHLRHVDLAFPAFGVSFAHQRTYRSRVDYDGPYGPGWDHGYNQRLLAEPSSSSAADTAPGDLPQAALPAVDSQASCGPVMILTTGEGTSLRFRETARSATTIRYSSDASRLTLLGEISAGSTRWSLTSQEGDVRRFGDGGLLEQWSDANGIGLAFAWEVGVEHDWRLKVVADSVGRLVEYRYDDADRLIAVVEPASGLGAFYYYGDDGELIRASRGDGRVESYAYDVLGGGRGDWIPEPQLHAACAQACEVSSDSCDAGGACDQAVGEAMEECLVSCPACASACERTCPSSCISSCSECTSMCDSQCDGSTAQGAITATCNELYVTSGAKDHCDECDETCEAQIKIQCNTALTCAVVQSNEELSPSTSLCASIGSFEEFGDVFDDLFRLFHLLGAGIVDAVQCLWPWSECDDDAGEDAWDALCDNHPMECCKDGDECGSVSCNRGISCESSCRATWLGLPTSPLCLPPVIRTGCDYNILLPAPETDAYEALMECTGSASAWSVNHGCQAKITEMCGAQCNTGCRFGSPDSDTDGCEPECVGICEYHCDTACHANDCSAFCEGLDFEGTCETSCTDACVDAAHAAGPSPGPKYGHPADLDFNLVRIYDGAGNLWLENLYATDVTSPDFDTVVHQQYGDFTAEMSHVDLRAILAGDASAPTGELGALVDDAGEYQTVDICPYACIAEPFDPRDLMVPIGDLLVVFTPLGSTEPARDGFSGKIVGGTVNVPPTLLRLIREDNELVAWTSRREAKANPLYTEQVTLQIVLPDGVIRLVMSGEGRFNIKGDEAALAALEAMGELTVFTDGRVLRAYPGHPSSAVVIASGTCERPFHLERTGESEVRMEPADACKGDLWVAPIASAASAELGLAYVVEGQKAIVTSQFIPTAIAPFRTGVVWTAGKDGALIRGKADSGVAEVEAAAAALEQSAATPIFSAPSKDAADEPFFVFHPPTKRPPFPHDDEFPFDDLAPPDYEAPCDPTMPSLPRRGIGPFGPGTHPAKATVVTDLHGTPWTMYADARGLLIRTVNHGTGATWSFEHDPAGQVTGIEAPDGARQCLRYDTVGNLTESLSLEAPSQILPSSPPIRWRYQYELSPSRLTAVMDPRDLSNALARYEYDDAGNLLRAIDAAGLATTVALTGGPGADRAQPARITDPSGAQTHITWDPETGTQHLLTVDATSTSPIVSEQVADEAGRPVWTRSPLGMVATASYDGPLLQGLAYEGDGKSGLTSFAYDGDGKVSSTIRGSHRTDFQYDQIGSLVATSEVALDASAAQQVRCQKLSPGGRVLESVTAEGHRARYRYDGEGRVLEVAGGDLGASVETWDDACPASPPGPHVAGTLATYVYDASGRLVSTTDERGETSQVTNDGFGRPVIATSPDGTTVRRGYDALGNVLWEAVYAPGAAVTYNRPALGDPGLLGAVFQHYDARARLVERNVMHVNQHGAPVGDGYASTRYAHDDVARTVTVTDDLGRSTVLRHDGAGRPIEARLPDGSAIRTEFLDGGRTVRRSTPIVGGTRTEITHLAAWGALASAALLVGTTELAMAQVHYDNQLRPVASSSVSGQASSTSYDAFDRVSAVTTTPGEVLTLLYDRDNRLTQRQSNGGTGSTVAVWLFEVDALGRPWRSTDPTGGTTTTEHEELSSLPSLVVDRRGTRLTYQWSSTGQLDSVVADAPAALTWMRDVAIGFQRDALGRVVSATRDDGLDGDDVTSWFAYDSLGALLAEGDDFFGAGAERTHKHDGVGRRYRSQLGPHDVIRSFDNLDRLTSVMLGPENPKTATFEYQGLGGPAARVLRSGVRTAYAHDSLGRLDGIADFQPDGKPLARWSWELPLDGVPRLATFKSPILAEASTVFGADTAGRLTSERPGVSGAPFALGPTDSTASAAVQVSPFVGTAATVYTLDGRNSWLSRSRAGVSTNYVSNALDAYTHVGAGSPSYDPGGAVVQDGTSTFTYDAFGQLATAKSSGSSAAYQRDGLGRIIGERDLFTGDQTRYAYDGQRRSFRRAPSGEVDVTIDGAGLDEHLLTVLASGARQYYHQDRLGSVYLVTNEAGAPLEWVGYTAYGEATLRSPTNQLLATSAIGNRFGFQGQQHNWATGLVDMRARHYRPTWGRFLTLDPIGLAGGPNLYAFVDASPLSFTDPLGLSKEYEYEPLAPDRRSNPFCDTSCHPDRRGLAERSADLARSQEPADTARIGGAFRVVTGTIIVVLSFPLWETPPGALAGIFALDQIGTGIYELDKGAPSKSLFVRGLESLGVPETWAQASEQGLAMALSGLPRLGPGPSPVRMPVPDEAAVVASAGDGPVVFKAPPGSTPEQVAQFQAYVDGCNSALCAGALSPTGRVSTAGALRRAANRAAARERALAAASEAPYTGHAGHVPDTTWAGTPEPFLWLDLHPSVNLSLGAQALRYPLGFRPSKFVLEPFR